MCQCDWNHNLASVGTISWPGQEERGFLFSGGNVGPLSRWNHNVAENTDRNHNVALGARSPVFNATGSTMAARARWVASPAISG